ncbi:MAG: LipQ [Rhodocyclaceae bacterium]|nr:MAG: LipQ [Rhodocyclaceae bacterium]
MRQLSASLLAICATVAHAAGNPTLGDIAYGTDPDQRYDLYRPTTSDNAPVILMVHGGGWRYGDKDMSRVVNNKVDRWLPRGIAFVSINYRMQPKAPPLEQARDVARALADVQRNWQKLGVDRSNIILMGHSAGAHLIALLGARPELLAEAGAQTPRGFILLDSGALDVPAIMNAKHFRLYDRAFGNNPADWRAASPIHHLQQATSPMLAVCSSRRDDACPQARAFVAQAQQVGTQAEVLALDKTHGEINSELGEATDYTAAVERFVGRLSPQLAERLR